jgi:hypothetical protein
VSETKTVACESCGARIEEGAEECPECGNAPGDVVRNAGVIMVFVGGAATTVSVPAGIGIVGVGVVVAAVGRLKKFEASDWNLNLSK